MFPEQHIFEVTCGQECIAAGTYFEQGGWNKTGGGGVLAMWQEWWETLWSKSVIFVNTSLTYLFNLSEFVFIVAVFIKKKNKYRKQ